MCDTIFYVKNWGHSGPTLFDNLFLTDSSEKENSVESLYLPNERGNFSA